MKSYTKIYFNHFGLTIADNPLCEVCNSLAVDIHHIETRSRRPDLKNDINNLMALCRNCHEKYGDKKQHKEMLKRIHKDKI